MPENSAALDEAEGFKAALLCEDDIGKVIRTHIYIESVLNEFIEFALLNPRYLKPINLDYSGKVNLAACIGLREELTKPLLQIGSIRNKFAHRPNQVINTDIVNNFYKSFSENQKRVMNDISKRSGSQNEDEKQKFMSYSMAVYYFLKLDVATFTQSSKIKSLLQAIGELHANTSESSG